MEWFQESIQQVLNWFTTDQYSFWEEWVAYILIQLTIWKIEFMAWSVQFSWGVAKAVLDQLQISQQLNDMWAATDSYVLGWLTYLKIPDGINMLLSSFVTRLVLRMMGFA